MSAKYAIPLLICQAKERISRGVTVQTDVPFVSPIVTLDKAEHPPVLASDSRCRLRLK